MEIIRPSLRNDPLRCAVMKSSISKNEEHVYARDKVIRGGVELRREMDVQGLREG